MTTKKKNLKEILNENPDMCLIKAVVRADKSGHDMFEHPPFCEKCEGYGVYDIDGSAVFCGNYTRVKVIR